MNIVLIIATVSGSIIALLLIAGLFTRRSYLIEREIIIGKSNKEVFSYLRLLKNQDHYNKWVMMDPNMKKTFSGTDGTVGFMYAWDGNKQAGAGVQEIMLVQDAEKIETEVRFLRPFKGVAHSCLSTSSMVDIVNNRPLTTVKWVFSSRLKYPMNLVLLFLNMDRILGKDIEISLDNLKMLLENKLGVFNQLFADNATQPLQQSN